MFPEIPFGLESEKGQRVGGMGSSFLDELDLVLVPVVGPSSDDAPEGALEESEVEGEGDLVALGGESVVLEEGLFAELGHRLDPVGVEEVVEEAEVLSAQVDVPDLPRFLQGWEDPFVQEVHSAVCQEGLELHWRPTREDCQNMEGPFNLIIFWYNLIK